MANNVLGSISIVITGDSSQLNAALASATAAAQSAAATISASMTAGAAPTQNLTKEFDRLISVIREESAAATLAGQRNLSMAAGLNGAAQGARNLGAGSNQATYGIRYMIFGLKDIGEGRYRYALAELVNVLLRMGPAALGVGAAIAVVVGGAYGIFQLNEHMRDLEVATKAAAQPFKELNDELLKSNDEMQVANDKLADELSKLQGHPGNGLALALDEAVVAADDLNAALHRDIQALQELLEKKEISSVGGFLKFEVPTTDLKKKIEKFNIEIADATREGAAKIRDASLSGNKAAEDAARNTLNHDLIRRYTQEIRTLTPEMEKLRRAGMGGADVFERLDALLHKGVGALHADVVPPSSVQAVMQYEQAISDLGNQMDAISLRADHDKLKPQVDAAKISNAQAKQAEELAKAKLEAQKKGIEEESALNKRLVDSRIEVSHAAVQAQITDETNRRAAAIQTAEEELRVAKAHQAQITADLEQNQAKRIAITRSIGATEGQGKSGSEAEAERVKAEAEVKSLEIKGREALADAQAETAAAELHVLAVKTTEARELDYQLLREIAKELDEIDIAEQMRENTAIRIAEIRAKGSGQEAELKATAEKLQAERAYGLEVAHTYGQVIDNLRNIAAIEERARQSKIADLQADLANAQTEAKNPKLSRPEQNTQAEEAAKLQVKIADLQQQSANANYAAQTKILETIQSQNQALQAQKTILDALTNWSQISVGTAANQFAQTLVALPQQIGESLARSIFTAPKKGQSKAGEIGQGLAKTAEKSGEQLAGKLITDAIEKLIVQLVGQAAISALQSSVQAASTAATIGLTAALIDQTIATWAQIGLLGFSGGGNPDPSRPFIAGENGPELIHPKGSELTVVPAGKTKGLLSGYDISSLSKAPRIPTPLGSDAASQAIASSLVTNNNNTGTTGDSHFHIYGMNNPLQASRQIATFLKLKSPQFSPLNR